MTLIMRQWNNKKLHGDQQIIAVAVCLSYALGDSNKNRFKICLLRYSLAEASVIDYYLSFEVAWLLHESGDKSSQICHW